MDVGGSAPHIEDIEKGLGQRQEGLVDAGKQQRGTFVHCPAKGGVPDDQAESSLLNSVESADHPLVVPSSKETRSGGRLD